MKNTTRNTIIFLAIIFFWITTSTIVRKEINLSIKIILWLVWLVLAFSYIYLVFSKFTESSKKKNMGYLEDLKVMSNVGYILGSLSILVGFLFLFSNRPDKIDAFIGMTAVGIIILLVMLFTGKKKFKN